MAVPGSVAQKLAARGQPAVPAWPWDWRGRQHVTAESVQADLDKLQRLISSRMGSARTGGKPSVAINGERWA